jgi:hypothetical protein
MNIDESFSVPALQHVRVPKEARMKVRSCDLLSSIEFESRYAIGRHPARMETAAACK